MSSKSGQKFTTNYNFDGLFKPSIEKKEILMKNGHLVGKLSVSYTVGTTKYYLKLRLT